MPSRGRTTRRSFLQGSAAACAAPYVIRASALDAVVVASPSQWKPLHTIAAARAGADVYCEKPMSLTVVDGRARREPWRL